MSDLETCCLVNFEIDTAGGSTDRVSLCTLTPDAKVHEFDTIRFR